VDTERGANLAHAHGLLARSVGGDFVEPIENPHVIPAHLDESVKRLFALAFAIP
jgi:hypothetical protein